MSATKKKGTMMTLKDFHGGSIPSDLPLPSAPGVTVRPLDRTGLDRQTSWVNPMGRSDPRLRPNSAGAMRTFGDNTPFLTHSSRIGRNFDEDERKPLDGASGPRQMVSDESLRAPTSRVELQSDSSDTGRVPSRPITSPVPQFSGGNSSSYAARFSEATHGGVNSQKFSGSASYMGSEVGRLGVNYPNVSGNSRHAIAGSYPNAWGVRKAVDSVPTASSAPDAALKLAHASALDKVSSGRWHTKQPVYHQTDVEDITPSETERAFYVKGNNIYNQNTYNVMDVRGERDYQDVTLARRAERSLAFDDGTQAGGKEVPAHERVMSPTYSETKGRNPPICADGVQQSHSAIKFDGPSLQSAVPSEPSDLTKLKLLPRSKPVENIEPIVDHKLGYQQPVDQGFVENGIESHENTNIIKPGLGGFEGGDRVSERPKLNLKPRSQPLEQMDGNTERGRNTLFGGARPREMVLKERGIDDVAWTEHDLDQHPNRTKKDVPRTEKVPIQTTTRYNEILDNTVLDHRIGKNPDRRDRRVEVERADVQKRNLRNENQRNGRETEQRHHHHLHHHQQLQERPPSPETWRKPVEQPKSASLDARGFLYGKAASAVELAQAFSGSISDPKVTDRFSGQSGLPSKEQLPFSRLTGPTPRPQINGY